MKHSLQAYNTDLVVFGGLAASGDAQQGLLEDAGPAAGAPVAPPFIKVRSNYN